MGGGNIQPEQRLQEALEYAENIVSTIREPLVVLDAGLHIISANQSFYRILSVTPGDRRKAPLPGG